jgi:hypothetical protein
MNTQDNKHPQRAWVVLEEDRGCGASVVGVFLSAAAAEKFLGKGHDISRRYCYLSSEEGGAIMDDIDAIDLITALKKCDMDKVAEGVIYWTLFNRGLSPDDATRIVQELLGQDGVPRTCVVVSLTPVEYL